MVPQADGAATNILLTPCEFLWIGWMPAHNCLDLVDHWLRRSRDL